MNQEELKSRIFWKWMKSMIIEINSVDGLDSRLDTTWIEINELKA